MRATDLGEKSLSELGQGGTAARSREQLTAELRLELAEGLTDAGGRQHEPIGGAAKVKLLCENEEHSYLTELDCRPHREEVLPDHATTPPSAASPAPRGRLT